MSKLVDTSVFCGYWPFRRPARRTPTELKAHLRDKGVTRAWVTPAEAILYPDPMQADEPLLEAVRGDEFFVPVAVVDPTLATWEGDARRCIGELGARALKLVPNYHRYELSDARVGELVEVARDTDVPVCIQLRMMDERSHRPLMGVPGVPAAAVAELAGRHPGARFLACGPYNAELGQLGGADNVWAEISFVESGETLKGAVDALGPERVVFGSHSPLFYFEAVAAKLEVDPAEVPRATVEAVRGANADSLLRGS